MNVNETKDQPIKDAVVMSDGELALSIVENLAQQVTEAQSKTKNAITSLEKNLEGAKTNALALNAQEALLKALKQEFQKSFNKPTA